MRRRAFRNVWKCYGCDEPQWQRFWCYRHSVGYAMIKLAAALRKAGQ